MVVHHPEEVLADMNEWCKEHHGKSGLVQRVRSSATTMQQAEEAVLAFIQSYVPNAKKAQLAGNSVHNDRVFLMRYMPAIVDHLDHRIVDVSEGQEAGGRGRGARPLHTHLP
jgi:oligoribonuclease